MVKKPTSAPLNSLNSQSKDNHFKNELKTILHYLNENVLTASMLSEISGVPQKNICRYKRDLEKRGLLIEVCKMECQKTGFRAWYITSTKHFNKIQLDAKINPLPF